jgi:hypothetical protein
MDTVNGGYKDKKELAETSSDFPSRSDTTSQTPHLVHHRLRPNLHIINQTLRIRPNKHPGHTDNLQTLLLRVLRSVEPHPVGEVFVGLRMGRGGGELGGREVGCLGSGGGGFAEEEEDVAVCA